VLNSLGSPASRRVYEYAIDQFIAWYCSEPRLAFNRIVVVRYRMYLESRSLAPNTIVCIRSSPRTEISMTPLFAQMNTGCPARSNLTLLVSGPPERIKGAETRYFLLMGSTCTLKSANSKSRTLRS
jgi:hypothetical protein